MDYSYYNYGYYQYPQGNAAGATGTEGGYNYPAEYYQQFYQAAYSGYPGYSQQGQDPSGYNEGGHQPRSQKVPPRRDEGVPSKSLWVGNVPPDTNEDELRTAFGGFGFVENIKVLFVAFNVAYCCHHYCPLTLHSVSSC